jgi:hypothetical protein
VCTLAVKKSGQVSTCRIGPFPHCEYRQADEFFVMRLFNEKLMDLFEIKSSWAFIYVDVELKTKVSNIPPPSPSLGLLIYVSAIDLTGWYILYINEV